MDPVILHFLGTGGGRHTMCTQKRRTAGIRLINGSTQVHIDPGPGALVHSIYAGLSPMKLSGVIVTHDHPDHYTDAEVLVEAMTQGTTRKRGVLAASRSVLDEGEETDRSVSRYHQELPARVLRLTPGISFDVDALSFIASRAMHGDPDAVSLLIKTPEGMLGYTSDTEAYPGYSENLKGIRLLILCTMWPRGNPLRGHLCSDDAKQIIEEAKPKCAVTTHYGIRILNSDPASDAAWLEEQTGVPVVSAVDGMTVTLTESITVKGPRKADGPRFIEA